MSCVTRRIVRPSSRAGLERVVALLLERGVPDGEDLVDQQDVGLDVDHHGERKPHLHPRRVVLELEVLEVLELGELDDGVVSLARLRRA